MKNLKGIVPQIKKWLAMVLIIASAAFVLLNSKGSSQVVKNAISLCMNQVVPSLLPFMVIAGFAVNSGAAAWIGRYADGFCRLLFGLPGCCFSVILLGLTGGFPVGAKMAEQLYRKGEISKTQMEHLLSFCVNAGPAFIIGTVGIGILDSKRAGIILLTSQLICAILLGFAGRFIFRDSSVRSQQNKSDDNGMALTDAFVCSVADGVKALMYACAFIVMFAVVLSMLNVCGIADAAEKLFLHLKMQNASAILPSILEVTHGCMGAGGSLPMIAFALGWGGLSVHFQIYSVVGKSGISKMRFMFFRSCAGMLSMVIAKIILYFYPFYTENHDEVEVFSPYFGTKTPLSAVVLILFALMLVWYFAVPQYKNPTEG